MQPLPLGIECTRRNGGLATRYFRVVVRQQQQPVPLGYDESQIECLHFDAQRAHFLFLLEGQFWAVAALSGGSVA